MLRDDLTDGLRIAIQILTVIYAVAFSGMIVTTALVTASDPTDPTPAFEQLIMANRNLDDGTGMSFINQSCQYYCNICLSHVFEGSKHCSFCNRCVFGFDHHCRWVSNDIGSLNYVMFIRMLIFTLFTLLTQVIYCVMLITQLPDLKQVEEESFISEQDVKMLLIATLILTAVLLLPIVTLLIFHMYLIKHKLSTISWIRRRQKRQASKVVTKVMDSEKAN